MTHSWQLIKSALRAPRKISLLKKNWGLDGEKERYLTSHHASNRAVSVMITWLGFLRFPAREINGTVRESWQVPCAWPAILTSYSVFWEKNQSIGDLVFAKCLCFPGDNGKVGYFKKIMICISV